MLETVVMFLSVIIITLGMHLKYNVEPSAFTKKSKKTIYDVCMIELKENIRDNKERHEACKALEELE